MILTDSAILEAMDMGQIEIRPFQLDRLGSNSYDLTLGKDILVYTSDRTLDCKILPIPYRELSIPNQGIQLMPGNLYLGYTNEYTAAYNTVPMIEGKSSIGRLGIRIHATAGFGDIGFMGTWTLEIDVVVPVIVYPNMPIAQIYFNEVKGECTVPYNRKADAKYSNQEGRPVPSAMWKNFQSTIPKEYAYSDTMNKPLPAGLYEQLPEGVYKHPGYKDYKLDRIDNSGTIDRTEGTVTFEDGTKVPLANQEDIIYEDRSNIREVPKRAGYDGTRLIN